LVTGTEISPWLKLPQKRSDHTGTETRKLLFEWAKAAGRDAGIDFDREAVELATWFHDAIYEIGRDDNEDRSAELAYELLESSPIRDEVARLVRVTKTHKVADDDVNGAVLSDADLSVLGSEPLRYRAYAATVRQEYADVPDEVFKPARVQALSALLEGPLFHTTVARQRWEERARQNIAEEIAALTA